MDKVLAFINGKKTYIVMFVTVAVAVAQAYGIHIPEYVYAILGGLGLGAIRHGISTNTVSGTNVQKAVGAAEAGLQALQEVMKDQTVTPSK